LKRRLLLLFMAIAKDRGLSALFWAVRRVG
jgi:hypothetical protein